MMLGVLFMTDFSRFPLIFIKLKLICENQSNQLNLRSIKILAKPKQSCLACVQGFLLHIGLIND
jgi:hypothetical protein